MQCIMHDLSLARDCLSYSRIMVQVCPPSMHHFLITSEGKEEDLRLIWIGGFMNLLVIVIE
jgi:hypothetical protein